MMIPPDVEEVEVKKNEGLRWSREETETVAAARKLLCRLGFPKRSLCVVDKETSKELWREAY